MEKITFWVLTTQIRTEERASSAPLVLQDIKCSLVLSLEGHDEVVWRDQATAFLVRLAHEDVVQA